MTTVAVIQPYFYPYAGYFRLFAAADTVVMFDCVQFPRRGWVHRNRFALATGELDWLTLPVEKADRDARIDELRFAADARARMVASLQRFPVLAHAHKLGNATIDRVLDIGDGDVASYLVDRVNDVSAMLSICRPTVRSSALDIDPELRAQDRVIAIVKALGGTRYVNPSGGRELYDHDAFSLADLDLRFLTPYEKSMESVLSRLLLEPAEAVAREVKDQTVLVS